MFIKSCNDDALLLYFLQKPGLIGRRLYIADLKLTESSLFYRDVQSLLAMPPSSSDSMQFSLAPSRKAQRANKADSEHLAA